MDHHHRHILLVTYPSQGHINPSLQFAKRLVGMGVKVTLATPFSAINRMTKTTTTPTPSQGLTITGFSDGCDDGYKPGRDDLAHYMSEQRRHGSEAVKQLITATADRGQPFTRVVYTTLLPWVGRVATSLHYPSTFLWIQPVTILDIYYYYFNGYANSIKPNCKNDLSLSIELPGLPILSSRDLPSFFHPSNEHDFALQIFKDHLDVLDEQTNPTVLNPSDTSFGGDLFQKSRDYIEWLDSKADGSVVYVSFGSISELSKQQLEEIAKGLLESHRPFLWVIRPNENVEKKDEDKLSCEEELEKQGMIVPWCSQVEIAVRVTENEEGLVKGGEFGRCIEIVMGSGEEGEEMRGNAKKWKGLAKEAAMEGGSSDLNLKAFLNEI
ncbi:hypothetical protein LOK49_LG08G02225 [Camellia lanceoleosa]|uniref:Uncharacterized protein n=1 Tax=Camellia lanceoleosa TaxID=1840588 RepID=A0ACC0GW38_9ERIC|nr:hypothetical protein LOK49_LG08G02225 [Camellia lanceoleosa]